MKHLCNCGEIVDADGDFMKIATCPNCGMYYIYANEIVHPHNDSENNLLKEIQSKVHSTHNIVVEDDAIPYVREVEKIEPSQEEVKVKPRPCKRR